MITIDLISSDSEDGAFGNKPLSIFTNFIYIPVPKGAFDRKSG
jgi:hypothetical protein